MPLPFLAVCRTERVFAERLDQFKVDMKSGETDH